MNKIFLKNLRISNFKGIQNLNIDFSDSTDIYAANGVGKTSIFDAFTWLLFGKDSLDRKDFQIKPLRPDGIPIQKIENEVEGTLLYNGETIVLKRVHREKWVKKRGFSEPDFTGNETIYFWNEVPMNAKEYTSKINALLDEQVFKLISNPLAFNNLKWQDRRKVLIDIAGEINVDYVENGLGHILELTKAKTIAEIKSEVNSKIKKIKEELKQIPTRIDEVQKSKPDSPDIEALEKEQLIWNSELERIENLLLDSSKANQEILNEKSSIQSQIYSARTKIQSIDFDLRNKASLETKIDSTNLDQLLQKLNDAQFECRNAQARLKQLESTRENKLKELDYIEAKKAALRSEWVKINAETLSFNENDFHCPACKREFEMGDVETKKAEMLANFNNSKAARLQHINNSGLSLKTESEHIENSISELTNQVKDAQSYLDKCNADIQALNSSIELEKSIQNSQPKRTAEEVYQELVSNHKEYTSLENEIVQLEKKLASIAPVQNEDLIGLKKQTLSNIDIINKQLSVVDQIKSADKRIDELLQEEASLSQSLLKLEKQEFDIEKYIKLNMEAIENQINNKFQFVKFRLFETQINGGEIECCDALIDGVPFDNANTASKVNAGIDIINTLCKFYKTSAPIFIDNKESVSNLIDSNSQIISLIVSPKDHKIRVESANLEPA